jgi:RNA polymerase sigma-70 factor (ECF subfamily)
LDSCDLRIADSTIPTANEVPEEVLLQRLRGGDVAAGEALVRRFQEPLVRYLARLTGNAHQAEDLAQQTWLSVLEHADRFDSAVPGGFRPWLFRIATNKANDLWRTSGRMRVASEQLGRMTEFQASGSDVSLEETEQSFRVRRAIDQLPEAQRQVVLLRYYGNLKFVEIAELLGCPLNTALGRMHKAMQKLKDMIDM